MKFKIVFLHENQGIGSLSLEAASIELAKQMAETQGVQVLSVRKDSSSLWSWKPAESRKQKFDVTLFSQELLALLESGLSLIESIEALAEKEQHSYAKSVFRTITDALYEGLPLSQGLERNPQVFTPLYVAMIRASERTGDMPHTLRRHVVYQGQIDAVKKKIISASIYPALLIVVGGLVVMFLLGYVVPRFSAIYETSGADLPWASQMLLKWGQLLQTHGQEVLFFVFALIVLLFALGSRPEFKAWLQAKFWQIPALGQAMRIYQLARFYRTMGMLLRGGIPLTTAMSMVASLLPTDMRSQLNLALAEVRDGKPFSEAMERHGLTTSIAIRMLRVGERTGQMGEMLERIGVFYDDETARKVDWFSKLLEPALMLLIGLIVGLVVVLMYMPIFELAGDIQ